MSIARRLRAVLTILAATAAVGAAGCQAPDRARPPTGQPSTRGVLLPETVAGGSVIVLYNRFTQRLLTYDTSARSTVSVSNAPNYIQYAFNTPSDVFTAGNSAGDGFSVLSVKDHLIRTVLTMPPHQGIFPLASDGNVAFFLVSRYDAGGKELSRTLATIGARQDVEPVPAVAGLVSAGALLGGRLYYTVFNGATNDYGLYSYAYSKAGSLPQKIRDGLPAPDLYVHAGRLFTSTGTALVSDAESFTCGDLCYFFDQQGLLIGMHTSDQGGLEVEVTDTKTHRLLTTSEGVIDFTVRDDTLTVYKAGAIDSLDIPKLKAS